MNGASFEITGMEPEHHCPNGHVNVCGAQTKNVHVCQTCGEKWFEDLEEATATPRRLGQPPPSGTATPKPSETAAEDSGTTES